MYALLGASVHTAHQRVYLDTLLPLLDHSKWHHIRQFDDKMVEIYIDVWMFRVLDPVMLPSDDCFVRRGMRVVNRDGCTDTRSTQVRTLPGEVTPYSLLLWVVLLECSPEIGKITRIAS